jgi:hypothetical protein
MSELRLTFAEERFIEGYAAALQNLEYKVTGDCGSSKSYDPMTVEGTTMHSYAFSMKDGGRHHSVTDYESVKEILDTLLKETTDNIKQHFEEND